MDLVKRCLMPSLALAMTAVAAAGCAESADSTCDAYPYTGGDSAEPAYARVSSGCADDMPRVSSAVGAVEDGILWVDPSREQAVVMNLASDVGRQRRHALCANPGAPVAREAHPGEQIVLCAGSEATTEEDAQPSELVLLDASGERGRFPFGTRFSQLRQSADGRYLLAYAPVGTLSVSSTVAVVDLDAEAAQDNPAQITPRSLSTAVLQGVAFSPTFALDGVDRKLVVLMYENYVNLIDPAHPEREAVSVPLTPAGSNQRITPREVLFEEASLFVRSEGSSDVHVLQLSPRESSGSQQDFATSILQLSASAEPRDMAIVGPEGARRLLVLSRGALELVDIRTAVTTRLTVSQEFDEMLLFEGASPQDPNVRSRLMLFAQTGALPDYGYGGETPAIEPGSGVSQAAFVDLEGEGASLGRKVDSLELGKPVLMALPQADLGRVVFLHGDSYSSSLSIVDLEDRTVLALESPRTQAGLLDSTGQRLWVRSAGSSNQTVAVLQLDSLGATEVLLDAPVVELLELPGQGQKMVALHPSSSGYLTVLEAEGPSRSTAGSRIGFFWEDFLERSPDADLADEEGSY